MFAFKPEASRLAQIRRVSVCIATKSFLGQCKPAARYATSTKQRQQATDFGIVFGDARID